MSNWSVSRVTNFENAFSRTNIASLDLSQWVLSRSSLTFMQMFASCKNLSYLNLDNWNTSGLTNLSYVFYECENLEELNLNHFNVNNVTRMDYMFYGCKKLKELDLSN